MYISRLRGLPIINVDGDSIGKLHDVVIQIRGQGRPPRVKGLVAELFARRRAYLPMERVYSIDAVQIVVSGVVNTRRFHRREGETLVLEDLVGRRAVRRGTSNPTTIFDVAMHAGRGDDWEVSKVALRDTPKALQLSSRVPVTIVPWQDVPDLSLSGLEGDEALLAEMLDMKPADVARELHDMAPERRVEIAHALEELPEDEQVDLITLLDPERAADVLEEMDPDDAADLIAELPADVAETLLKRMRPEDAQDVRDLLAYDDDSAGGMMTPEPVIVASDSTVADALALA